MPSETRQAFPDGTTGFERILPGPDRMYPDTDTPPLPIPDTTVAEVRAQLAETPWHRQARYEQLGVERRMARALAASVWKDLFDEVAPAAGEPARRLAGALEKRLPFHMRKRKGARASYPTELPDPARLAPLPTLAALLQQRLDQLGIDRPAGRNRQVNFADLADLLDMQAVQRGQAERPLE